MVFAYGTVFVKLLTTRFMILWCLNFIKSKTMAHLLVYVLALNSILLIRYIFSKFVMQVPFLSKISNQRFKNWVHKYSWFVGSTGTAEFFLITQLTYRIVISKLQLLTEQWLSFVFFIILIKYIYCLVIMSFWNNSKIIRPYLFSQASTLWFVS